jgi:hypothetical protein
MTVPFWVLVILVVSIPDSSASLLGQNGGTRFHLQAQSAPKNLPCPFGIGRELTQIPMWRVFVLACLDASI